MGRFTALGLAAGSAFLRHSGFQPMVYSDGYCSPPSGPLGRTGGALVLAEPALKVAVFIDWQNAYKTAREAFGMYNMPNEHGNFSPFQLGRIFAAGNGRGAAGSELVRVELHRGLPSQKHDAVGYAANRRQSAAWMKENRAVVIPRLRPLRYPRNYPQEPAVEKGVDVQLAVAAVGGPSATGAMWS